MDKETQRKRSSWIVTRIKSLFGPTAFFTIVYLVGWYANGWLQKDFDLTALVSFYMVVIGKSVGMHAINSAFNSPKGEMVKKD